jgi:hypothetical protein
MNKDIVVDKIDNENDFVSIDDDEWKENEYEKSNNYDHISTIVQCFKTQNYNFSTIPTTSFSTFFMKTLEYELDKHHIEIDFDKLDKLEKSYIKTFFDILLSHITNVKDLDYLFNDYSIPFLSQKFHLILKAVHKTKNYDILEHILLITSGNILPIVSFYKDKPLINDINIIQLLNKYGYFNSNNILFQNMTSYPNGKMKALVEIIMYCDANVIDYILTNIFPFYYIGTRWKDFHLSIETISVLIKHGLLDLYRYYVFNTSSYKLALMLYDIDNKKAYKVEQLIISIYDNLLFFVKNKHLIRIISLYIDPNDDINYINKQIEDERELLVNGMLFDVAY